MHFQKTKLLSFSLIALFLVLLFHTSTSVKAQSAPLSATCAPSQASVLSGDPVSWTVTARGASGAYAYAWADTAGVTYLAGSNPTWNRTYANAGTYSASLYVSSTDGQTIPVNCSPLLTVTPKVAATPITATCAPSASSIEAGQSVTWNVTARGGSGAFAYAWSDTAGATYLSGGTPAWTRNYANPNTYSASLYVSSTDGQNIPVNCSPLLTVTAKVVAPATPPAPTNPSSVCSTDGKSATITWNAPAGYATFFTRASTGGLYIRPFVDQVWDENFVGTSKTFSTIPGTVYYWWVHTKNTSTGAWSAPIEGTFTCIAPTPVPQVCLSGYSGTYPNCVAPRVTQQTITATPSSGTAPMSVRITGNMGFPCISGNFALEYGDGARDQIAIPADSCSDGFSLTHTYTTSGTYSLKLISPVPTPYCATCGITSVPILAQTSITVNASRDTDARLLATPSSGTAPLSVQITGSTGSGCNGGNFGLEYGDGVREQISKPADFCSDTFSFTHSYRTIGTYNVLLVPSVSTAYCGTANCQPASVAPLARTTVTVQASATNAGAGLLATPSSGPAPLTVSLTGSVGTATDINSTRLDFGDGQGSSCWDTVNCTPQTHTYTSPGTYRAVFSGSGMSGSRSLGSSVITVLDALTSTQPTPHIDQTPTPTHSQNTNFYGQNQFYGNNNSQNQVDAPGSDDPANCVTLTKNLVRGSTDAKTNGEVTLLQKFLGVSPSGYFGTLTQQAVKKWQIAQNMQIPRTSYGSVGPLTRKAIVDSCSVQSDDNLQS